MCRKFLNESFSVHEWPTWSVYGEVQELTSSSDRACIRMGVIRGNVPSGTYSVLVESSVAEEVVVGEFLSVSGLTGAVEAKTLYSNHSTVACRGVEKWLGS